MLPSHTITAFTPVTINAGHPTASGDIAVGAAALTVTVVAGKVSFDLSSFILRPTTPRRSFSDGSMIASATIRLPCRCTGLTASSNCSASCRTSSIPRDSAAWPVEATSPSSASRSKKKALHLPS